MRAGLGKWELTPPMGVELAGYGYYLGRCAQSVRDPLFARALALETDELRALIISCDLLGLSREVCQDVFTYAETLGYAPENVLILSIHTHTGPCIKYHEGCGFVNEDYVATVAPAICRAIDAAVADLDEVVTLEKIFVPFEGEHIYNRTIENGPVDRIVRGFAFQRRSAAPIAAVSAACHGVFRGRSTAVSADFAGEINRLMAARGMDSIYLNGLCGDIDPSLQDDGLLDSFAQLVADTFDHAKSVLPMTLQGGCLPFTLKLTPVTTEDIHQAAALAVSRAGGKDMPAARVALTWEREMTEKFSALRDEESITVKFLLLGGVPVIALPFEGFTQIGMDIRRLCGREDALVLGCAEELLGYLPTRDDIARGTYAALESTFLYKRLPVVPGEAERLGEETGIALERILS
ncbi:MAG: hypothetical protein IKU34_02540 [Clostridia bacterium]|nr:hypothetical protein [Clostridia bacterium]